MEKLMFALVGLFFLFSSPYAAANISTVPVDKYCYMLIESPQNHSVCRQSYNYDSIDVYFKDFNGNEVKAVVKRQFSKTAPTVLINAQYSFEAVCAEGVRCDTSNLAQDTLMAFRQAVVDEAFYTYVDARPCTAGVKCSKPQSTELAVDTNTTSARKNTQAMQNTPDVEMSHPENLYKAAFDTDYSFLGFCKIDPVKGCRLKTDVVRDSMFEHNSVTVIENTVEDRELDRQFSIWLTRFRPQFKCRTSQTDSASFTAPGSVNIHRQCSVLYN